MLSSSSLRVAEAGLFIMGRTRREAAMAAAKIKKTLCQGRMVRRPSASGAPMICPTAPAAEVLASAAQPFGQGAKDRLTYAPGQVLDRNGQRELCAEPSEFFGDGDLKDAKGAADGEAHHYDDAADDQHRRDKGGGSGHDRFVRFGLGYVNSGFPLPAIRICEPHAATIRRKIVRGRG